MPDTGTITDMQVSVVLPENDVFDHDTDPARPVDCICGPYLERVVDDQLEDTPPRLVVVHRVLARATIPV